MTHQLATTPWYNDFALSYGLDFKGKIEVVEGYGEINLPVLKDAAGARLLEFNGAAPSEPQRVDGRRDGRVEIPKHHHVEAQRHLRAARLAEDPRDTVEGHSRRAASASCSRKPR